MNSQPLTATKPATSKVTFAAGAKPTRPSLGGVQQPGAAKGSDKPDVHQASNTVITTLSPPPSVDPNAIIVVKMGNRDPVAIPRSALLQRTFTAAANYIYPQINEARNAHFKTKDLPGYQGTSVNVSPEHWEHVLPYVKTLEFSEPQEIKFRDQDVARRALKVGRSRPVQTRKTSWSGLFWECFVLMVMVFVMYQTRDSMWKLLFSLMK